MLRSLAPVSPRRAAAAMEFRVQLDRFFGPLDLLLHLVRKQELEAAELPLANVTQQYLDHVAVLESIDIDIIGDFLDVASSLIEIKSKLVLPQHEEDSPPEEAGPSPDLVRRLLEYKRFRDAASKLEHRRSDWRQQFAREANDLPGAQRDAADEPIQDIELWDLVGAFGRVMRERLEPPEPETIPYDNTPMHVMVRRVFDNLTADRGTPFADLFPERVAKSTLVGMFLAMLELIRRGHVLLEQDGMFGGITLRRSGKELVEGDELEVGADEDPPAARTDAA